MQIEFSTCFLAAWFVKLLRAWCMESSVLIWWSYIYCFTLFSFVFLFIFGWLFVFVFLFISGWLFVFVGSDCSVFCQNNNILHSIEPQVLIWWYLVNSFCFNLTWLILRTIVSWIVNLLFGVTREGTISCLYFLSFVSCFLNLSAVLFSPWLLDFRV